MTTRTLARRLDRIPTDDLFQAIARRAHTAILTIMQPGNADDGAIRFFHASKACCPFHAISNGVRVSHLTTANFHELLLAAVESCNDEDDPPAIPEPAPT